jgi:CHASE3 domain sensor protein
VSALVGGLLLLLLVTAAATTVSRLYATSVGNHVRGSLRPAQQSVTVLSKDYVDMETGVRGYLLTRDDQFLTPYESGRADVTQQEQRLRSLLSFDDTSLRLVGSVDAAGETWLRETIEPAIAGAREGTLDSATMMANAMAGKQSFDVVRARLAELQSRADELTAAGLQQSTMAQNTANVVTIVCAAFAVVLAVLTVLLLRRSLDAPLRRLLEQVRQVSDGRLDSRVDADGPVEVAELGQAVETMRVRIISETGRATEASEQLVRLAETDRIALELGDTVIKRLFAIGLALQSATARFPVARPVFTRAVADLDQAINQLRSSLYGHIPHAAGQSLGMAVQTLVSELEAEVGVVPELVLTGDLDREVPGELVAAVLEVLRAAMGVLLVPGRADPVEIGLSWTDGVIRLRVSGPVPESPATLEALGERARLHGGDGRVGYEGDRVVIDWWVPV